MKLLPVSSNMISKTFLTATCVLSLFLLSGCSTTAADLGLLARLRNRGPVPVSAENSHLAGNMLLAKQQTDSLLFRNFLANRGRPTAIEVEKPYFSPLKLQLYYPEQREVYSFEKSESDWEVSGPGTLSSNRIGQVAEVSNKLQKKPGTLNKRFTNRDSATAIDTPTPPTEKREKEGLDGINKDEYRASFRSPLAETISAEEADFSPRGDLIHPVHTTGQSLTQVVEWYTGNRNNTPRIAKINQIDSGLPLEKGAIVVIPSYLIQNKSQFIENPTG